MSFYVSERASSLLKFLAFHCEELDKCEDFNLKDLYDTVKARSYSLEMANENTLMISVENRRWFVKTSIFTYDPQFKGIWDQLVLDMKENNEMFS
jgi:hypothetical protein